MRPGVPVDDTGIVVPLGTSTPQEARVERQNVIRNCVFNVDIDRFHYVVRNLQAEITRYLSFEDLKSLHLVSMGIFNILNDCFGQHAIFIFHFHRCSGMKLIDRAMRNQLYHRIRYAQLIYSCNSDQEVFFLKNFFKMYQPPMLMIHHDTMHLYSNPTKVNHYFSSQVWKDDPSSVGRGARGLAIDLFLFNLMVDSGFAVPPALTHLSLRDIHEKATLSIMPPTLTHLALMGDNKNLGPLVVETSELPRLAYLKLVNAIPRDTSRLPGTLKVFSVSTGSGARDRQEFEFRGDVDRLPAGLEVLRISCHFNRPVDRLPAGLKQLYINGAFNFPVDKLPAGLQKLSIRNFLNFRKTTFSYAMQYALYPPHPEFDHSLDYLPSGIVELYIRTTRFTHALDRLPRCLKLLSLEINVPPYERLWTMVYGEEIMNLPLLDHLPFGLESLMIRNNNVDLEDFPPGIKKFVAGKEERMNLNRLPRGLKRLEIVKMVVEKIENLPPALSTFRMAAGNYQLIDALPASLETFYMKGLYSIEANAYPEQIQEMRVKCQHYNFRFPKSLKKLYMKCAHDQPLVKKIVATYTLLNGKQELVFGDKVPFESCTLVSQTICFLKETAIENLTLVMAARKKITFPPDVFPDRLRELRIKCPKSKRVEINFDRLPRGLTTLLIKCPFLATAVKDLPPNLEHLFIAVNGVLLKMRELPRTLRTLLVGEDMKEKITLFPPLLRYFYLLNQISSVSDFDFLSSDIKRRIEKNGHLYKFGPEDFNMLALKCPVQSKHYDDQLNVP